tara:strand:- start:191 stop:514 length:324 start_codon:yes stop_codon:yes gene_type:complete
MRITIPKLRRTVRRVITETSIASEEWDEFIERACVGGEIHFEWCKNFLNPDGNLPIEEIDIEMMMEEAHEDYYYGAGETQREEVYRRLERLYNEIIEGALSGNPIQY